MDLKEKTAVLPWVLVFLLIAGLIFTLQHKTYLAVEATRVERLVLPEGAIYKGQLENGLLHGQGELHWLDGSRYEGEFAAGHYAGKGLLSYPEGDEYRGTFVQDGLSEGEYLGADGSHYRGQFSAFSFHGEGELKDGEGNIYRGHFEHGSLHGAGVYIGQNGDRYEGEFFYGAYHGQGVLNEKQGTYTGNFEHGEFHGQGEYHSAEDDSRLSGHWRWGQYDGVTEGANRKALAREVEKAIYQQGALLQQVAEQLQSSHPQTIDLYFVGVGGYSRQDVFRKELEFVRSTMDEQFGSAGRSMLLMNHRDTLDQLPLATPHSINAGLQSVASKMDPEKDILLLYLTSHGSKEHEFSLVQQGLTLPDLSAEELGEMVHALPIKWKIVIISACYSGGFIPFLQSPTTLVMTAARHDRKSFGCSDESDMTYFGRALFEQALPTANSFEEAFALSQEHITNWEKELGKEVKHSYPQMVMGEEIKAYLPAWWQTLPVRTGARSAQVPEVNPAIEQATKVAELTK